MAPEHIRLWQVVLGRLANPMAHRFARCMEASLVSMIGLGFFGCAATSPEGELSEGQAQAVISGAKAPEDVGISVGRLERNAVLGELVRMNGSTVGGCCGTLVGDRVVVSASHCVVLNQEEWVKGSAPRIVEPDALYYVVGSDIDHPVCRLRAESVHIHPQAEPVNGAIHHDVSVTILQESVLQACPGTVPIAINREEVSTGLVGETLLQGGFGATDTSGNYSSVLYWAALEVKELDSAYITVKDIGKGFPSYGDSGSGLLRRFPDQSLRVMSVLSAGSHKKGAAYFARLDVEASFLDQLLQNEVVCGEVSATGTCRDGAILQCTAEGFRSTDCQVSHRECTLSANGTPSCVCSCDVEAFCQQGCACDPDCVCPCDITAACDTGCACDRKCPVEPSKELADAAVDQQVQVNLEAGWDMEVSGDETVDTGTDSGADPGMPRQDSVVGSEERSSGCSTAPGRPTEGTLTPWALLGLGLASVRRKSPRRWRL